MSLTLKQATTSEEIEQIRALFLEYAQSLGFSLCFQGFDAELAGLPGDYAPPEGRLLLALWEGGPAGCGALDGGTVARAPTRRKLREICGIASNPGDLPVGTDPRSVLLRQGYFDSALELGGVRIRRDFRWQDIEPTEGQFDFSAYDALVGPLAPSATSEVLVVADGPLAHIPIEVLTPRDNAEPWGATHVVTYLPSASVGVHLARSRRSTSWMRAVLAIGDPAAGAGAADAVYPMDRLQALLPEADFVALTCPLTPETTGLIGRAQFARMKRTAILVNMARGLGTALGASDPKYLAEAARQHLRQKFLAAEAGITYPVLDVQGAVSWATWQTLVAAVEATESLEQETIANWLLNNKVETIIGEMTFDPNNQNYGPDLQSIKQVQDGKWVVIYPSELAAEGAEIVYSPCPSATC